LTDAFTQLRGHRYGEPVHLGHAYHHIAYEGITIPVTHGRIAELRSTAKTNEGATFANDYCWVCRFDGEMIVEVRAHLDSAMVDYTVHATPAPSLLSAVWV
jgi:hypothetical protein